MWRRVLIGMVGPSKPSAANQPLIDIDRVRPFNDDRLFGWRRRSKCVAERNHARIEYTPRGSERFVWFQNNRKLGEVKAADKDQCSGTQFSGIGAGIAESVSYLAQHNEPEGRWQVEHARIGPVYPVALLRHFAILVLFLICYDSAIGYSIASNQVAVILADALHL